MALSSSAGMPGSDSITTSRLFSDWIVGALSGVAPGLLPMPIQLNIEHAPSELVSSSTASVRGRGPIIRRSGLVRMVALLRLGRPVVELRDREAGLRGVGSETLLLRLQSGDGDLLQRGLLLRRQCGDARRQDVQARVELGDAAREVLEARGLLALRP